MASAAKRLQWRLHQPSVLRTDREHR
ncbi:hypothetical protein BN12_10082 [Nostocoides japonicum T1-X7]|uniref:Uncharacterized protein n=1 Tax=Nostocoides japonicum T1-X7 TaxID=1194083 RepID=A0A077LVB7_9MICO|nr:hypothetical protein BN12_10082 [Tetrasphaera japonica T1-X7]